VGATPAGAHAAALANMKEFVAVALESLEARVDRNLSEIGQRLDALQDCRDQQRMSLRQLSHQMPEVSNKLDQLWSQCQYYFPRVKEHDVHFSFFRTSFETHKQSMLDYADGLDQREHRASAGGRATTGNHISSPVSSMYGQQGNHGSSPVSSMHCTQAAPPAPMSPMPPTTTFRHGAGLLTAAAAAAEPALASGMPHMASPFGASRAAAEEDAELDARARMLAQVMERLHGRDHNGGLGSTSAGAPGFAACRGAGGLAVHAEGAPGMPGGKPDDTEG